MATQGDYDSIHRGLDSISRALLHRDMQKLREQERAEQLARQAKQDKLREDALALQKRSVENKEIADLDARERQRKLDAEKRTNDTIKRNNAASDSRIKTDMDLTKMEMDMEKARLAAQPKTSGTDKIKATFAVPTASGGRVLLDFDGSSAKLQQSMAIWKQVYGADPVPHQREEKSNPNDFVTITTKLDDEGKETATVRVPKKDVGDWLIQNAKFAETMKGLKAGTPSAAPAAIPPQIPQTVKPSLPVTAPPAAPATTSPGGFKPGQKVIQNGVTYVYDGKNWNPQ